MNNHFFECQPNCFSMSDIDVAIGQDIFRSIFLFNVVSGEGGRRRLEEDGGMGGEVAPSGVRWLLHIVNAYYACMHIVHAYYACMHVRPRVLCMHVYATCIHINMHTHTYIYIYTPPLFHPAYEPPASWREGASLPVPLETPAPGKRLATR